MYHSSPSHDCDGDCDTEPIQNKLEHVSLFTLTEKRYQLKQQERIRIDRRTGRRRRMKQGEEKKKKTKSEDLEFMRAVYDFASEDCVEKLTNEGRVRLKSSTQRSDTDTSEWEDSGRATKVWELMEHSGAYYVQNMLNIEEQKEMIEICAKILPERPNKTNHFQRLNEALPENLFKAAKDDLYLSNKNDTGELEWIKLNKQPKKGDGMESKSARFILRKLRWATVGPAFDWTKRVYEEDAAKDAPLVDERIRSACKRTLERVFGCNNYEFDGQVGLANFYAAGDTLNGHVDDAETNLSKPIASLSLGLPAIFLLGKGSKDVEPITALFIKSGDAIVLSGQSRTFYHGVPRVFDDDDEVSFRFPDELAETYDKEDSDEMFLLEFARRTRINVSLRDVR